MSGEEESSRKFFRNGYAYTKGRIHPVLHHAIPERFTNSSIDVGAHSYFLAFYTCRINQAQKDNDLYSIILTGNGDWV